MTLEPQAVWAVGGLMKAPKIQRIGTKIPKKNIHPCPFLSVITPSVIARSRVQEATAGTNRPPHGSLPCLLRRLGCAFDSDIARNRVRHPSD